LGVEVGVARYVACAARVFRLEGTDIDNATGLGAAKRFPGLDKAAFPKAWNLIESLPKPKYETLDAEAALKTIKEAKLSSPSVSVLKDEPLGLEQDASVVVDSAE
jgi:hypothetical protein